MSQLLLNKKESKTIMQVLEYVLESEYEHYQSLVNEGQNTTNHVYKLAFDLHSKISQHIKSDSSAAKPSVAPQSDEDYLLNPETGTVVTRLEWRTNAKLVDEEMMGKPLNINKLVLVRKNDQGWWEAI